MQEHHKDPADRIIITTALAYDARLASLDGTFTHEAIEMHVHGLLEDGLPIQESHSFAEYIAVV